jgi:hypothetical protein
VRTSVRSSICSQWIRHWECEEDANAGTAPGSFCCSRPRRTRVGKVCQRSVANTVALAALRVNSTCGNPVPTAVRPTYSSFMAKWAKTRKVSGWIAFCSLGSVLVTLALFGGPGICGFTGGLLGDTADEFDWLGIAGMLAFFAGIPLFFLSFPVWGWLAATGRPHNVVDPTS